MSLTTSPTKRQQVINEITENIRRGILEPGTRLATVRDMSAHFDVSLSVIQNALRELTDNGFVECRGASGFYVRETPAESPANKKIHKNTRERIFLSALHHSDLVWRYPYGEYEKIREEQLEHLLKLAGKYKQFHFCVEQAEILRVYLRKHPEDLRRFKALLKEGRFEYFGGLSIPDLNLISGESIVRNLLLGRDRAIVSAIPGTTRDTVEAAAVLRGLPVKLTDTAGVRESGDPVEQLGIERSFRSIAAAGVTFWLLDASVDDPAAEVEEMLCHPAPCRIAVWNKIDLVPDRKLPEVPGGALRISVREEKGIEELLDAFVRQAIRSPHPEVPEVAVNARAAAELKKAAETLPEAARDAKGGHVAGLLSFQPDEDIAQVLLTDQRPEQKAMSLILQANMNGGSDNVAISYWEAFPHD